jgi:hypothetical protein
MAMLKLRRASSIAMPRPIPREAPVTRATCGVMANFDSTEGTEFEARVAPPLIRQPAGPFEPRIRLQSRANDGFLPLFWGSF